MTESRVVITADAVRAIAEFNRFRAQAVGALEHVSEAGGMINKVLGGIGVTLSAAAFTGWIKGAIDATDAADDLSQKTGIAVEDLAGLELSFQKGGMEASALEGAMVKLSKQMVDGNAAFDEMGVTSKNLDGTFKSNKEMLYELADRFAAMDNGVKKAALAQEIFGKSGAAMIPMLNEGSKGLREMDEMAHKLGLSLSEQAVEQAGQFNDTLDLLARGGQGVSRGIAAELLPTLSNLSGQFLTTMTSGDRLKKTADFLATGMKLLYTAGIGGVEVFATVGKTIGTAGAQMVALLQGDFKLAAQIGREWQADIGNGWKDTVASINAAWSSASNSTVDSMAKITRASTVMGESALDVADASKTAAKAQSEEAKVLMELSGLTANFAKDWDVLSALYGKGRISIEQLTKAQAELLAKQPAVKAANEVELAERKALAAAAEQNAKAYDIATEAKARALAGLQAQKDENEQIGLNALELAELNAVRLEARAIRAEENADIAEGIDLTGAMSEQYRAEAEALRRQAGEQRSGVRRKIAADEAKSAEEEWKRAADNIDKSLTDALLRGFESGQSIGKNLVSTLKNMFSTLVLKPVINAVINPVAGALTGLLGMAAPAAAAGGGNDATGTMLGAAGLLGAGGMFGAGGLTGALVGGAGWLTGATTLTGSMTAATSLMASGAGGILPGLGMLAGTLAPIALGLGAAVALWKKFDTSGTYHTGGAASATGGSVSTVRAESLHFERTRTNADTESFVGKLASGVVTILDSTALAFGKTAGYTAATAFADDTSKDGAWGGLVISKLGEKIVDWQDTRSSRWAPKEFANGEAGQKQYLAELSKSVRVALDGVGLPGWAKEMLDAVGQGAGLDELAKVVDGINQTQTALKLMGQQLVGFSSLSDAAVSALMKAAGGIQGLASNASAYYDNFYSQAEKEAAIRKELTETLQKAGLAVPATREAYRALLEQQLALGAAGAEDAAVLFRMAQAFAQLNPELEQGTALLEERTALQEELNRLTKTDAELLAQRRDALDPANRALFDQVQAAQEVRKAQDAAKSSLGDFIGQMKSFGATARGLNSGLMLGGLSTLTPEQQYAEARRQFERTRQLAAAGDATAQGNLSAVEQTFLELSQRINGGDSQYSSDLAAVMRANDELAEWAGESVNVAQASLNALTDSGATLADISATLKGMAQGAPYVPALAAGSPGQSLAPVAAIDYAEFGAGNTVALVEQVRALRAQVADLLSEAKGRRNDAQRQTGDLIQANDASVQSGASTVVEGVRAAVKDATHVQSTSTREPK